MSEYLQEQAKPKPVQHIHTHRYPYNQLSPVHLEEVHALMPDANGGFKC